MILQQYTLSVGASHYQRLPFFSHAFQPYATKNSHQQVALPTNNAVTDNCGAYSENAVFILTNVVFIPTSIVCAHSVCRAYHLRRIF